MSDQNLAFNSRLAASMQRLLHFRGVASTP
jgi:hypothetical protein